MICVDYIQPCLPNRRWKWDHVSHLYCEPTDDLELLHDFALKLGMRRHWFQVSNSGMPHYDLNAELRVEAILLGAREVTSRTTLVNTIRAWRTYRLKGRAQLEWEEQ